jgi:hypothetical protein
MARKDFGWQLPQEIPDRLGANTYGRQRPIYEHDHLLLILHDPPVQDTNERTFKVFLRTPDGRWQCNGQEDGEAKLTKLLKQYDKIYDELEDSYKKAKTAEDLFELIDPLTPISRSAIHMKDAVQAARELVPDDKFLINARDEAYEVARGYEILLADAKLALDFRLARNGEKQARTAEQLNRAQHKLNVLAAITFPLMAIATIFGMNIQSGLERMHTHFFWIILILGIVVGAVVKEWVTRSGRNRE